MKLVLGIVLALVSAIGLWLLAEVNAGARSDVPISAAPDANGGRQVELEGRVARLEGEVQRLAMELAARSPVATTSPPVILAPAEVQRSGEGVDARWYLRQYVRSFEAGGEGSEYFRLAVDAYAVELLDALCAILRDDSAPPPLRARVAPMLGTPRFAGNAGAVAALLALLRTAANDRLGFAAVDALRAIGDAQTGIALERLVWELAPLETRKRTLAAIVQLDGPDANRALQRLFVAATTTEERSLVLAALSTADAEAALEVFGQAANAEDPVRLQAANAIQRFRGDAFRNFIDHWLTFEREPQVRAALGAARTRMNEVRPYAAQKAVGPPDAEPGQDHPNAWASQQADGGLQWLELGYKPSRRASAVRIHEVCVAGAVVQVVLIDDAGRRHKVWEGVDPTRTPGVFEVRFPPTGHPVRGVRVVLDTNKQPGWSEVDAVELVGPDGSAWAAEASASSSYGQ